MRGTGSKPASATVFN